MLAVVAAIALQERVLSVFAAASLKESFTAIGRAYERTYARVRVRFNFAGSQTLAAQIKNGALADVFASASAKNMDGSAIDRSSYRIFAQNKLQIAVRRGFRLGSLRDLSQVRNLVVADPAVPVGRYTEAFLLKAASTFGSEWLGSVRSHIVSRELDVKSVLTKVSIGEADAGIVYASDIVSAKGKVSGLMIPDSMNQLAEYPVAQLTYSQLRDEGKNFVKFLFKPEAQRLLEQAGFISPVRTVKHISLQKGASVTVFPVPLPEKYSMASVSATNEKGMPAAYRGVPVLNLPFVRRARSATFFGADGYAQTISIADLKKSEAVLVLMHDGNYQLIVPRKKPSVWVNWLRRIELH